MLPVVLFRAAPLTDLSFVEGQALIDTGATISGISARVAAQLGLARRGKRPLGSAQGEGQAERYLFRVGLKLPSQQNGFPFIFDDVDGFEIVDSFSLEALIGMDILSQCDFSISRDRRCELRFG